jgi:hypothetical protein
MYKQYVQDENAWIALVRDVCAVCIHVYVYVRSKQSQQPLVRLLPDSEPEEDDDNSRFFGARSTPEFPVQLLV